ncbi:rRNA maturation RNase YbeY [Litorisediminicola beolgyonensis]|uniref:Endoribonuclease YbeY n=1 Tax=Litorisediminicola beolgyonensis TaxID=1173614 RepID=A0ABW3ZKK8_9RHOB
MLTETVLEGPDWEGTGLAEIAERAAQAALRGAGVDPEGYEIAVLGCSDARIATLNAEFRKKPRPTNVLSWPAWDLAPEQPGAAPDLPPPADEDEALGDIALAFGVCTAEALAAGLSFDDHVTHLVVHGTLHLLGYDHETDADALRMEALETKILAGLGIADPYAQEP